MHWSGVCSQTGVILAEMTPEDARLESCFLSCKKGWNAPGASEALSSSLSTTEVSRKGRLTIVDAVELAGFMLVAPSPPHPGMRLPISPPVQFPVGVSSKHPRQSDRTEQSDARPSTGVRSPGSLVSPCTGLGVRMAGFPFGQSHMCILPL